MSRISITSGWAIPDGVSFLMFVYFDKTACLPVLSVFRWVLPQGSGVKGAYRGFSAGFFWRDGYRFRWVLESAFNQFNHCFLAFLALILAGRTPKKDASPRESGEG